jgi:hypothetical protein
MVDKELLYVSSLELEPASQYFEHLVGSEAPHIRSATRNQDRGLSTTGVYII